MQSIGFVLMNLDWLLFGHPSGLHPILLFFWLVQVEVRYKDGNSFEIELLILSSLQVMYCQVRLPRNNTSTTTEK